jgi:hypothetical protein
MHLSSQVRGDDEALHRHQRACRGYGYGDLTYTGRFQLRLTLHDQMKCPCKSTRWLPVDVGADTGQTHRIE